MTTPLEILSRQEVWDLVRRTMRLSEAGKLPNVVKNVHYYSKDGRICLFIQSISARVLWFMAGSTVGGVSHKFLMLNWLDNANPYLLGCPPDTYVSVSDLAAHLLIQYNISVRDITNIPAAESLCTSFLQNWIQYITEKEEEESAAAVVPTPELLPAAPDDQELANEISRNLSILLSEARRGDVF